MYQCQCHTCEEDHLEEDLESAQGVFNEHALQQHEVVLRRVVPKQDGASSSGSVTTASGADEPGDEALDGHRRDG